MKLKARIYALFQFFSFASIIFLCLSLSLSIMYFENKNGKLDKTNLENFLINLMKPENYKSATEIASTIFIYLFIILYIFSCIWGWRIFWSSNKNYYDELFLMFLIIPIIGNIFALLAQLALKIFSYRAGRISSKELNDAVEEIKKDLKKSNNLQIIKKHKKINKNLKT